MGFFSPVESSELKAFGIGTGVGATVGAVITGAIAYKLAEWRIRVKEEETLKKSFSLKEEQLEITYADETTNLIDEFNKQIAILLPSLEAFDTSISDSFKREVAEKCLPQKNPSNHAIYNVYPIALSSIIGPNQSAGPLQTLNEIMNEYMQEKDFEFDQYTAIIVSLSNIIFTMMKYISELRKIPGEDSKKKLEALEKNVEIFFSNLQKSALVEARESSILAWMRDKFKEKGFDILSTKRGGFVGIMNDEMKKVFQEAYSDQEKITATLISESATQALENEIDAASEFILRSTVSQAAHLPQNFITKSKLIGNIAQLHLKGTHTTYNQAEGYVYLVETHVKNSSLLHTPVPIDAKNQHEINPSPHFSRLMNLGGNQQFNLQGHTEVDLPFGDNNEQIRVLSEARNVHLYLKYINLAAALQADLTSRLDRFGWEGLKVSGEFDYRSNLIQAFRERANDILQKAILNKKSYFTEFLNQSIKIVSLSEAKSKFNAKSPDQLMVKEDSNKIFGKVEQNGLLHFTALANIESQQNRFAVNTRELQQVTSRVEAQQDYSVFDNDPELFMNIALLLQEDERLHNKFQDRAIQTNFASIQLLIDNINKFSTQFEFPVISDDKLKEGKKEININDVYFTYGNKTTKIREFIRTINENNSFSKYFHFDDKNDQLRLKTPYFSNIRELNEFFKAMNSFLAVMDTSVYSSNHSCKAIKDSSFYSQLKMIQDDIGRLLKTSSPENLQLLEAEEKNRQIILLQGIIVKTNEDFVKMLDGQFDSISQLIISNNQHLGQELASQYHSEIEKKRTEIQALQKNIMKQMNGALVDKQRDHDSQLAFLTQLSTKVTDGYISQTQLATNIFTKVSSQLSEVIATNKERILELEARAIEVQRQKETTQELQTQTESSLKELEDNHKQLIALNQELSTASENAQTLQSKLITFISEFIQSKKVAELSDNIGKLESISLKDVTNFTEIQSQLKELSQIANFFTSMLINAEALLKEVENTPAFDTIDKAIQQQKAVLEKNKTVIENLTKQVELLQGKLIESYESNISDLRSQVERTKTMNDKLESSQNELKVANQQFIKLKDERIDQLNIDIQAQKTSLTDELNRAYQDRYNQEYSALKDKLSQVKKEEKIYMKERERFLETTKTTNPVELATYEKISLVAPTVNNDINKQNYESNIKPLSDLKSQLAIKEKLLGNAKEELIKKRAVYEQQEIAARDLQKFETELKQKHLQNLEETIAALNAEKLQALSSQKSTLETENIQALEQQIRTLETSLFEKRSTSLKQDKQQVASDFHKTFEPFLKIIDNFRTQFLNKHLNKHAGDKYSQLNHVLGQIDALRSRNHPSEQETVVEMRKLLIKFCALCMQKQSNYSMFLQTTTGKHFFDFLLREEDSNKKTHTSNPDNNIKAINEALGSDVVSLHDAEKRYRYRDFAAKVSGLLAQGGQLETFKADTTVQQYAEEVAKEKVMKPIR